MSVLLENSTIKTKCQCHQELLMPYSDGGVISKQSRRDLAPEVIGKLRLTSKIRSSFTLALCGFVVGGHPIHRAVGVSLGPSYPIPRRRKET